MVLNQHYLDRYTNGLYCTIDGAQLSQEEAAEACAALRENISVQDLTVWCRGGLSHPQPDKPVTAPIGRLIKNSATLSKLCLKIGAKEGEENSADEQNALEFLVCSLADTRAPIKDLHIDGLRFIDRVTRALSKYFESTGSLQCLTFSNLYDLSADSTPGVHEMVHALSDHVADMLHACVQKNEFPVARVPYSIGIYQSWLSRHSLPQFSRNGLA